MSKLKTIEPKPRSSRWVHFLLLIVSWLVPVTCVFAASPRLSTILPRGIQRGTEQVITFSGSKLADGKEILFYEPGFEVTKIEPDGDNSLKATIKVAADCRLGEHVAQVHTASGISDYRTFYVGALPAVDEKEPNSDFDTPQKIPLNVTVQGIVQSEDVDYFVIEAIKGQRISVEVEGMRLGTERFDPYVAILNDKRFELLASDDTPLVLQDCVVAIVVPEDGKYTIELRESAYGGSGNSRYRMHVGTFPRPTAVYPAGGKLGEEMEIRFLGDPAGELTQKVKLPEQEIEEFGFFATDDGGISPSPNPFHLFEHGNVLEIEPNNSAAEATEAQLPLAQNGIISSPNDVDFFKFDAKKGAVYEVECYARRLRSALDPVVNLCQADGKSLAGNDDSRGPDSYFRYTIPADGQYAIRVTDHLGRGGPEFVYRVELQPVQPKLTLSIPRVERYGQYRQTIYVARGNRFATLINASRANFGGDLVLDDVDLPAGITMTAEPMPANLNSMPVLFEAAADAPIDGKLVDFTAHHADPKQKIGGHFHNRADFLIGPPGQSLYRWRDVDKLAIAVVEELPFRLEIVEPKVPLVRNGSMQLKIVVHRNEGFTAALNVQLPFRPPGVGAASSVNIPEGKNEVVYPINANNGAQIKKWKIYALGSADVNGSAIVSSQLAVLEVAEPYVTVEMQRVACEQGQPVKVFCKIQHNKAFEGKAQAQLLGLPAKVTAENLEFDKATEQLVFEVKTDKASPAGKHKNMFCRVTVPAQGESMLSRAGGAELQIDKPLPAPAKPAKPAPVAQAKAPEKPSEKPLSRLQKLRLEAKQRAEKRAQQLASQQ